MNDLISTTLLVNTSNSRYMALEWRAFEDISSNSKAATAAACCAFSLSTLEVASLSNSPSFALTERKQPEAWRWAIIGLGGLVLEEGCEGSQSEAKNSAAEAFSLMMAERSA
jgi:hypothetical protein